MWGLASSICHGSTPLLIVVYGMQSFIMSNIFITAVDLIWVTTNICTRTVIFSSNVDLFLSYF